MGTLNLNHRRHCGLDPQSPKRERPSSCTGDGRDLPFPHEDRRDVTLWRLYVFYCGRMDGVSVSGSRPAVPSGVLPAGELPTWELP